MIIMEWFKRTHTGPKKAGDFWWRFVARGYKDARNAPYYELNFIPKRRRFTGTRVEGNLSRAIPDHDVDKLRSLLSPEDVTACTLAAIEASR